MKGHLIFKGEETESKPKGRLSNNSLLLNDEQKLNLNRKLQYVRTAENKLGDNPSKKHLDIVISDTAEKLDDRNPPSISSVFRWWKKWVNSQRNIDALIEKKSGPKSPRALCRITKTLAMEVVDEIYLNKQKRTKVDVYDRLVSKIKEINKFRLDPLKLPSQSTVRRFINKLNDYEVTSAREGKIVANKKYRVSGKGVKTNSILERVEVDHTPLDVIVVDPVTGYTEGRPYLTALLDHRSRYPLGIEIGFEPPSQISVMRALRNSILPKSDLKQKYKDLDFEWPAYGIMNTLICDNGLEFHSKLLQGVCNSLNIELQFCPKGKPEYKGSVERFLGTLNRAVCHNLPGTTFSNIRDRGNYDSEKEALITLEQLKELINEWIVNIYSQSLQKGIQNTPFKEWVEGLENNEPILPESVEHLDLLLTREETRKLTHKGIEFEGLYYNSAELGELRIHFDEVLFRVNDQDIGSVWVYDKINDDYLKVECTDFEYANGLSSRENKLIRKQIHRKGRTKVDLETLLKNKERFREKIKKQSTDKLMKERRKAARHKAPEEKKETSKNVHCIETSKNDFGIEEEILDWSDNEIPEFGTYL
ncbi:MAG: transposase [Cytophagia bacterium]|nr:transposase [Cytophagia bacterium]